MKTQFNMTKKGRRVLGEIRRDGISDTDLDLALLMEVASRMKNGTLENLLELTVELLEHYGSYEAAISALRNGEVGLEKVS